VILPPFVFPADRLQLPSRRQADDYTKSTDSLATHMLCNQNWTRTNLCKQDETWVGFSTLDVGALVNGMQWKNTSLFNTNISL
jgi:hypothetical protein